MAIMNNGDDRVRSLEKKIEGLVSRIEELEDDNQRLSTASQAIQNNSVASLPLHLLDVREAEQSRPSQTRWKKLRQSFHDSFQDSGIRGSCTSVDKAAEALVFLHPEDVGQRNYTQEELGKIQLRPFPSRLYITNVQLEWNTVWLRTRHTDHHSHKSSFIQIRDAFKADVITNNPTGAKYSITELLNMCYGMDESDYYSFACTVASAFSNYAERTTFEKDLLLHPARIEQMERENTRSKSSLLSQAVREYEEHDQNLCEQEEQRARVRLLLMMNIVFSKLKQKKILVDDSKHNIYRLVLCMTKYNHNQMPMVYAIFSFLLQLCAAVYVVLSLTSIDGSSSILDLEAEYVYQNIALATGSFFYGIMVALPELKSTNEVYRCLYRSDVSLLAIMDFIVNAILPVSVAVFGLFVVLQSDSFLDGVLNVVALYFITEIDDHLPRLLELDTKDIVQGFLMDQAMEEYETQDLNQTIEPMEFSDMHITNTKEGGSAPSRGVTFQPYEVFGEPEAENEDLDDTYMSLRLRRQSSGRVVRSRKSNTSVSRVREGDMGLQVANKRSVTADCLLRKIEWQYTGGFDDSSLPRIGHLRLHKLLDNSLIDIVGKQKDDKKPWFAVTGVYIISSFSMSDDILRLRITGSLTCDGFLRAFNYYSLWPISHSAFQLLKRKKIRLTPEEAFHNEIVLYGTTASLNRQSIFRPSIFEGDATSTVHEVSEEEGTKMEVGEEEKEEETASLNGQPFFRPSNFEGDATPTVHELYEEEGTSVKAGDEEQEEEEGEGEGEIVVEPEMDCAAKNTAGP